MAQKKKKWVKFRHKVVHVLFRLPVKLLCILKYKVKVNKLNEKKERQYLILFNHQTAFDQFFVGLAFKRPVYYVASEDLFSNGFSSSLIEYLVAPIPIKKQATDVRAVMNCIKVAREGGTIALSPEGNRTYSGRTEYIAPQIAPLARKLGLPIALYRIEGGYGVHPRWADKVRRGGLECRVSRIVEPEEYSSMTDDELLELIDRELYVNEASADKEYKGKGLAEHLERAIYWCPDHGLSAFKSRGDVIECQRCGKKVRYLPTKELRGIDCDFPYRFVLDWYSAQSDYVNGIDTRELITEPLWVERASVHKVIPYERKVLVSEWAEIKLYGDRISAELDEGEHTFPFDKVSAVTVLGRNKLNIYIGDTILQFSGNKSFNALKYVNLYTRHRNICKGEENVQFLGL